MLTGVSLTRSPAAGQQSLLGSDSGVTHRVTDESEPRVEPVHGRLRPLTPGPPKRAIVVVGSSEHLRNSTRPHSVFVRGSGILVVEAGTDAFDSICFGIFRALSGVPKHRWHRGPSFRLTALGLMAEPFGAGYRSSTIFGGLGFGTLGHT